jgi:catechol 2,3-dioxygenase-like lactoylglutathione lyase family enzyme
MAIKRLDNVAVVVEDLDAAIAFFGELGMELEGRASVEGDWVDRVVGLQGTRSDIAMMRTPDGQGRLELTRYRHPAAVGPDPRIEPANTRGMGRIMFNVVDIDDVVERLTALGGALVGEIVDYEDIYRLCYLRGPEGIIVGLAQDLPGRPG